MFSLNRRTIVRSSLVVLALALGGCAANVSLHRGQTALLSKGASDADVNRILDKATVQVEHEFEAQGKKYTARHYNLQTGSTQQMTMVCTPTCFPVFYTVPITTPYVVVSHADTKQLFAWGTVEELSRSPDDAVSSIMPPLKASQEKALAAKKK